MKFKYHKLSNYKYKHNWWVIIAFYNYTKNHDAQYFNDFNENNKSFENFVILGVFSKLKYLNYLFSQINCKKIIE